MTDEQTIVAAHLEQLAAHLDRGDRVPLITAGELRDLAGGYRAGRPLDVLAHTDPPERRIGP